MYLDRGCLIRYRHLLKAKGTHETHSVLSKPSHYLNLAFHGHTFLPRKNNDKRWKFSKKKKVKDSEKQCKQLKKIPQTGNTESECTMLARTRAGSSQKKLELGGLGSARRQGQNPSLARLGFKIIWNFWADLDSGSEEVIFTSWARLRLGGSETFELYPIRPNWT